MSVALAGSAPATFEIKSANLPLVALLLKSADLSALAADLSARYGDMPDFFDQDPVVIDVSALAADDTPVDFPALMALLRPLRLLPLAVRGGSPAQMAAAQVAGLVPASDATIQRSAAAAPPAAAQDPSPAPSASPVPPSPPPAPAGALVVDRPLRSGQQVYARGRDLVVLAMVNPGAEVIADGNIHVYAPLRGKAMAGARGNADARIFALSLEPELVSIAGIYRTSETPLPDDVRGKAAQVRLSSGPDGDKLVMDALNA